MATNTLRQAKVISRRVLAGKVVPKLEVEAHLKARRIIDEAQAEARLLFEKAKAERQQSALRERLLLQADALGLIAQHALALSEKAKEALPNDTERVIEVAVLLAERLLGHALGMNPSLVASLAKQVLEEAQATPAFSLHAHPEDVEVLRVELAEPGGGVEIDLREDESLARGELRLVTPVGVMEANLHDQLSRLGVSLKQVLQAHAKS